MTLVLRSALLAMTASSVAHAAPTAISPLFSSGMVLQRDAAITVTGSGPENGTMNVSLGKESLSSKVGADGTWKAEFAARPAGGPFVLEASDGSATAKVEDVLIGDVWVCSGQSNMQMGLDEAIGGAAMIAKGSADERLRVLVIPKAGADKPQTDPGAKWSHASPETLKKFSAVGASFALHLRDDPKLKDVPLGIVDSSFGGTAIEAWTPEGTMPTIPESEISGSMFGISPGHLFNRMIAPLTGNPIKGVLWYQGESNGAHPGAYASLLSNFATQWRKQWKQPELPFFIVQLPAFSGNMGGLDFSWLREAQAKGCAESKGVHLAVTHDTTNGYDLHPVEKEEIGRRISLLARKEVFGSEIVARGPQVKDVKAEGKSIVVTFDQTVKSTGGAIRGFAIAGDDGDYRFADAVADDNSITLTAESVPVPKTVRFAWGGLPDANLVNREGLPPSLFRTDTLAPHSLAFQPLPTIYRLSNADYQVQTNELGHVSSIIVGGKQFLSMEPGGGTSLPGGFGPRALPNVKMTGPDRIECRDGEFRLEIACHDDSMEWTFTNNGGGDAPFQIALSEKVTVSGSAPSIELTRDQAKIRIEGVESIEPGKLVVKVKGHSSQKLKWSGAGK